MMRAKLIIILCLINVIPVLCQDHYAFFERYDIKTKDYLNKNNFKSVKILTNSSIVNKANNIDEQIIKKNLDKILTSDVELLVIDWEKEDFWNLKKKINQSEFKIAEKKFIELINIIKNYNPNIKLGIYGLPFKVYYNLKPSYNEFGKFDKILSLVDVICPSLYFSFTDATIGEKKSREILSNQLRNSLEYGARLNKPVIPFIWELIHPNTKKIGGSLVPKKEFKRHLNQIKRYNVNGHKIEGLIWWSPGKPSEVYNSLSKKNGLSPREIRSNKLIEYFNLINSLGL